MNVAIQTKGHATKEVYIGIDARKETNSLASAFAGRDKPELIGKYSADLDRFLALVRGEHPELPRFLVGHSMGGLITAAFVSLRSPDLLGLVTSGAALAPPPAISRGQVRAARMRRKLAPFRPGIIDSIRFESGYLSLV